jgi:outer membrane protein
MKKVIVAIMGLIGTGLCAFASAAPVSIGIVDMQQVLQQSPKVTAVSEKLKKQFAPEQNRLMDQQKHLKELAGKLNRDAATMQAKDKDALQAQIDKEQKDLMEKTQAFQQKAFEAQQKEMQNILLNVTSVVKDIAKKNNLGLVVDKGAVVYANEDMDITAQVKKALS